MVASLGLLGLPVVRGPALIGATRGFPVKRAVVLGVAKSGLACRLARVSGPPQGANIPRAPQGANIPRAPQGANIPRAPQGANIPRAPQGATT